MKEYFKQKSKDDDVPKSKAEVGFEHIPFDDTKMYIKPIDINPNLRKKLDSALSTLNSIEQQILELRFAGKTLDEVAVELKSTRYKVGEIERRAIKKLRHSMKAKYLIKS